MLCGFQQQRTSEKLGEISWLRKPKGDRLWATNYHLCSANWLITRTVRVSPHLRGREKGESNNLFLFPSGTGNWEKTWSIGHQHSWPGDSTLSAPAHDPVRTRPMGRAGTSRSRLRNPGQRPQVVAVCPNRCQPIAPGVGLKPRVGPFLSSQPLQEDSSMALSHES